MTSINNIVTWVFINLYEQVAYGELFATVIDPLQFSGSLQTHPPTGK